MTKNVQREGKGSDGGRGQLSATLDGVGGLPALKVGDHHLAPLAAKEGPESSIRTLYVYWGLTLVRMDQILPRGTSVNFGPPLAALKFKRIGTKVWAFLRDRGLHSNVQRALCTVEALSKTYRLSSARWRIAGAPISIHILGSWSPYTPNGTFGDHFCASWAPRPPHLGICKCHTRSPYFLIIRTTSSPNSYNFFP